MFVSFPKIKQFRQVVREVAHAARFRGLDEDQQPIYENVTLPSLTYRGTVKLHGTNAGIVYHKGQVFTQSRRKTVTGETKQDQHYGFYGYVQDNLENITKVLADVSKSTGSETVSLYGEWFGSGVQHGVAVSQVPKGFYPFALGLGVPSAEGMKETRSWIGLVHLKPVRDESGNVVFEFKTAVDYTTFFLTIDFDDPIQAAAEMERLTLEVEERCPVGQKLGAEGVGESIVWTCTSPGWSSSKYWFKTKGDKHSVTKVKKVASVDPEKHANAKAFVEAVVTEQRLEQAYAEFPTPTKADTGNFIKWVNNDVFSEEMDTLTASGLIQKDVISHMSRKSREWFFKRMEHDYLPKPVSGTSGTTAD